MVGVEGKEEHLEPTLLAEAVVEVELAELVLLEPLQAEPVDYQRPQQMEQVVKE